MITPGQPGIVIAGREFVLPVVEGLSADPWLNRIQLLLREGPTTERGRGLVRVTFTHVIEHRCFAETMPDERERRWDGQGPYRSEEVIDFGEAELTTAGEQLDEVFFRLTVPPTFRDPRNLTDGMKWIVQGTGPLRLVWLKSFTVYLEFLYLGRVKVETISIEEAQNQWVSQQTSSQMA